MNLLILKERFIYALGCLRRSGSEKEEFQDDVLGRD